ncbi:unnamed protein product [Closterium sp. Naga37s-1]|nr:unnamed protein product [Closterium sp. Naga37s-1]
MADSLPPSRATLRSIHQGYGQALNILTPKAPQGASLLKPLQQPLAPQDLQQLALHPKIQGPQVTSPLESFNGHSSLKMFNKSSISAFKVTKSQARRWLSQTLSRTLPADKPLSDLLGDGEILLELACLVQQLLAPDVSPSPAGVPLTADFDAAPPANPRAPAPTAATTQSGAAAEVGTGVSAAGAAAGGDSGSGSANGSCSSEESAGAAGGSGFKRAYWHACTNVERFLKVRAAGVGVWKVCRRAGLRDVSLFTSPDLVDGRDVCRLVGLRDVSLFTSPDLVDGRDVRRVCLCLRTLSKRLVGIRPSSLAPSLADLTRAASITLPSTTPAAVSAAAAAAAAASGAGAAAGTGNMSGLFLGSDFAELGAGVGDETAAAFAGVDSSQKPHAAEPQNAPAWFGLQEEERRSMEGAIPAGLPSLRVHGRADAWHESHEQRHVYHRQRQPQHSNECNRVHEAPREQQQQQQQQQHMHHRAAATSAAPVDVSPRFLPPDPTSLTPVLVRPRPLSPSLSLALPIVNPTPSSSFPLPTPPFSLLPHTPPPLLFLHWFFHNPPAPPSPDHLSGWLPPSPAPTTTAVLSPHPNPLCTPPDHLSSPRRVASPLSRTHSNASSTSTALHSTHSLSRHSHTRGSHRSHSHALGLVGEGEGEQRRRGVWDLVAAAGAVALVGGAMVLANKSNRRTREERRRRALEYERPSFTDHIAQRPHLGMGFGGVFELNVGDTPVAATP